MVHDQLHIRGGHQVSWLIDGVPVPNTNIASNVGPQFDPKDIDYLEVQRGGYSAEYGDRTYGVFNVVTRSGFERRDRQARAGRQLRQLQPHRRSVQHRRPHRPLCILRAAFPAIAPIWASKPEAPRYCTIMGAGLSGLHFSDALTRLRTTSFAWSRQSRGDHYQVPNDPDQQALGIRDVEDKRDDLVNFPGCMLVEPVDRLLSVSPFYHFNRAHYIGGYVSKPDPDVVIPEDDRGSNYLGGVVSLAVNHGKAQCPAPVCRSSARATISSSGRHQRWQQSAAQPTREIVWETWKRCFWRISTSSPAG